MSVRPVPVGGWRVLGLGLDARKQAVFRMAFRLYQETPYTLLLPPEDQRPDVILGDLDSPEGTQAAAAYRAQYPETPFLGITLHPEQFPSIAVIGKPLRMETLFPALASLHQARETRVEPSQPGRLEPTLVPQVPSIQVTSSPLAPVRTARTSSADMGRVDLLGTALGLVRSQAGQRNALQIRDRASGKTLWVVDPSHHILYAFLSSTEELHWIGADTQRLQTEILGEVQVRDLKYGARAEPLSPWLWRTTMMLAAGRLPAHLVWGLPVRLRQWPDLTRLPPCPEVLRLCAFLARSPASPALIQQMLHIAPTDLANALGALDSLQLLIPIPPKSVAPASEAPSSPTAGAPLLADGPPPISKRPFLSRLLARIARL